MPRRSALLTVSQRWFLHCHHCTRTASRQARGQWTDTASEQPAWGPNVSPLLSSWSISLSTFDGATGHPGVSVVVAELSKMGDVEGVGGCETAPSWCVCVWGR